MAMRRSEECATRWSSSPTIPHRPADCRSAIELLLVCVVVTCVPEDRQLFSKSNCLVINFQIVSQNQWERSRLQQPQKKIAYSPAVLSSSIIYNASTAHLHTGRNYGIRITFTVWILKTQWLTTFPKIGSIAYYSGIPILPDDIQRSICEFLSRASILNIPLARGRTGALRNPL